MSERVGDEEVEVAEIGQRTNDSMRHIDNIGSIGGQFQRKESGRIEIKVFNDGGFNVGR
jgi:hypothetical protein